MGNVTYLGDLKAMTQQSKSSIPDYYRDGFSSQMLAKKIESYWHRRGYKQVKAWVEVTMNVEGTEKYYSVRSNISFKVPRNID